MKCKIQGLTSNQMKYSIKEQFCPRYFIKQNVNGLFNFEFLTFDVNYNI